MLRSVLTVVGTLVALIGLLFVGQGLGYVRWPASSFMIAQQAWVNRGAMIAVAGLAIVLFARRLPRRRGLRR